MSQTKKPPCHTPAVALVLRLHRGPAHRLAFLTLADARAAFARAGTCRREAMAALLAGGTVRVEGDVYQLASVGEGSESR